MKYIMKYICKHVRLVTIVVGALALFGVYLNYLNTDTHLKQAFYTRASIARVLTPCSNDSLEAVSKDLTVIKRIIDSDAFIKTAHAAVQETSADQSKDIDVNIIAICDIVLVDESNDIKVGASTGQLTIEMMALSDAAFAFLPTYITEGKGTYRNIILPADGEKYFAIGEDAYQLYRRAHRWQSPIARIIARKLLDEGYLDHCQAAVVYLPFQFGLHFPHPKESGRPYATHVDGKLVIFASAMSKLDMIGSRLYHAGIIERPELEHEYSDDVTIEEVIRTHTGK